MLIAWRVSSVALALLCIRLAAAQIHVVGPERLVQEVGNGGWIMGATATFGAPFYLDRVLGRLTYPSSKHGLEHCTPDDYDLPSGPALPPSDSDALLRGQVSPSTRLLNIAVVQRGGNCSITTKVRVAQGKGAHAVIIVDKYNSNLTSQNMRNVVLTDDGYGNLVHIPSVFISKEDGKKLLQELKYSTVVVELEWRLPKNHVVKFDWWISSSSVQSFKLLKDFSPKRRVLNQVLRFQPHYAVFSIGDSGMQSQMCLDPSGQYCAEDPDGPGPITGVNVLHENVRQLCIHEVHKVPRISGVNAGAHFAEKFWDYIDKFMDRCPLDGRGPDNRFGLHCSMKLMSEVGINRDRVNDCVKQNTYKYLEYERDHPAWSTRALRINGWRYSGLMDADLITRAICAGFIEMPAECRSLVKKRNPMQPYITKVEGFTYMQLAVVLLAMIGIFSSLMWAYKRSLTKRIREEVMLEVQSQLSEYRKMRGS